MHEDQRNDGRLHYSDRERKHQVRLAKIDVAHRYRDHGENEQRSAGADEVLDGNDVAHFWVDFGGV